MIYGIAGNTDKAALWSPVATLVAWFEEQDLPFFLHPSVAAGLRERELAGADTCRLRSTSALADEAGVILSFGGDGTLLRNAHEVGTRGTPILGVHIGRLGFLADVDITHIQQSVRQLEAAAFSVEERMVLTVEIEGSALRELWALNDVVITRAGSTGLVALDVAADGTLLNRYWADGLIVSTPTGSTAYSLAVGGPIVVPGSDVILVSPIAPHSLTVRPVVLPSSSLIEARVTGGRRPYVLAVDGESTAPRDDSVTIRIRRAPHCINFVKLTGKHYFQTLRSKLSWGVGPQAGVISD